MSTYTYGSFQLNANASGYGFFFLGKKMGLPGVKVSEFPVFRGDRSKISGVLVDARQVDVQLKIVGSSRPDLMSRLDTLQQALSQRGQPLIVHEDGRQFLNAYPINAPVNFLSVIHAECTITFRCPDPYAYSTALSTYSSGTLTLTLSSGTYNFPTISLTNSGTVYAYPLIRLTNQTSTGQTTLTANRNSGTAYTTLTVAATPFSAVTGDKISITHGGTTQTLTISSTVSVGATTINVSSFTASANYVSGDVCLKLTQWTAVSITENSDNHVLTVNNVTGATLPVANGDYLDIQCDPANSSGETIQLNGDGIYREPIGLFPVIEVPNDTLNISITSVSQVKASVNISWYPRWMS